jgi:glycosyltransferase involved in cell wall biosynthesis
MNKHLLMVSEYWHPDEQGGGERSASQYAKALSRLGWSVTVITSASRQAPAEEMVDGVRILRRCVTGRPDSVPGNIMRQRFPRSALHIIEEYCKRNPVDVIHLMNTTTLPLAPRLRRITKAAITAHLNSAVMFCPKGDRMRYGKECRINCSWDEFVPCYRASRGLGKMRNKWWLRDNPLVWSSLFSRYRTFQTAMPSIDGWVAIGGDLVALLRQHGASTVTLLPNPVDMASLLDIPLPKASRPLRVGFVGALTDAKGVRVLADAIEGLDAELHVAGDGPLRATLASRPRVVLHGQLKDAAMAGFYSSLDLIVVPSMCVEAFGRVAVEAMAAGRPVIASDIGGLRDILGDCRGATLIEPGSTQALRNALARYCATPRRCSRDGDLCRRQVQGRYRIRPLATALSRFLSAHIRMD